MEKIACLLVMFFTMLLSHAQTDAIQAYKTGMQYYNQKKYSDAVYWLKKAADGKYAYAYFPLAISYHSLPGEENHEQAYWNYGKVLGHKRNPEWDRFETWIRDNFKSHIKKDE